jgi:hypothetical protein
MDAITIQVRVVRVGWAKALRRAVNKSTALYAFAHRSNHLRRAGPRWAKARTAVHEPRRLRSAFAHPTGYPWE